MLILNSHCIVNSRQKNLAEMLLCLQAKTDAVERLEAAFLRAQEELGFTHGRLEATEDELAECQEMLEELQSKSLEQSYHLTALQNQIKASRPLRSMLLELLLNDQRGGIDSGNI